MSGNADKKIARLKNRRTEEKGGLSKLETLAQLCCAGFFSTTIGAPARLHKPWHKLQNHVVPGFSRIFSILRGGWHNLHNIFQVLFI